MEKPDEIEISETPPQTEFFGSNLCRSVATSLANATGGGKSIRELPSVELPDGYQLEIGNGSVDFHENWANWLGSNEPKAYSGMVGLRIRREMAEAREDSMCLTRIYTVNVKGEKGVYRLLRFRNLDTAAKERGKGFGSYMVRRIQELAVELGVDAVYGEIGSLDADNERRRRFYQRNGFTILDADSGDCPGMAAIYWRAI